MVEVSRVTLQVVSEKQKRPKLGESRAIRICNTTPRGLAMFLPGNEGTPFTAVGNAFFSAEYFADTQRHSRFYRSTMATDEFSRERVRFTSSNLLDQRKIRYPAKATNVRSRSQVRNDILTDGATGTLNVREIIFIHLARLSLHQLADPSNRRSTRQIATSTKKPKEEKW